MRNFPVSPIFLPANRIDWFEKAKASSADGIIFDLEDSIPENDKDDARKKLINFLLEISDSNFPIFIRFNSPDTEEGKEDYACYCKNNFQFPIIVPKVEGAKSLEIFGESIKLIALIETPLAVRNIAEIASDMRLLGLALGPADLSFALGSDMSWDSLLFSRSKIVLESSINGIYSIDGPFMDISSEEDLISECIKSKNLGFNAKMAIHPSQVSTIRKIFLPTKEEIIEAKSILETFKKAQKGVIKKDGKMIDKPIIESMKKKLILAGEDIKEYL